MKINIDVEPEDIKTVTEVIFKEYPDLVFKFLPKLFNRGK